MASDRDVYRNIFRGDQLASAALVSARRAVRYHDGKTELDAAYAAILYALDPTDEAMVEAVCRGLSDALGYEGRLSSHDIARAAIAAIRDHITGEGA